MLSCRMSAGDAEEIDKYERRTVRVSKDQCEDVKKLLRLMGVPVVDAPSEAEAQCAQMCKDGLVCVVSWACFPFR